MRFMLLIFILCALNISDTLQAQDTPLQLDIRIRVSDSDPDALIPQILATAQSHLQQENIQLNAVEADEHLFISLYNPTFVSTGLHYYAVTPSQVLLATQPPIVSYPARNLYERGLRLPLADIDPQLAADLTTQVALYSLGLCATGADNDLAGLIHQLEQADENPSRNLQIATLYFYAGNCAVQTGDYEQALALLEAGLAYEGAQANPDSIANLAWVYTLAGEPATATDLISTYVAEAAPMTGSDQRYLNLLFLSAQLHALAEDYNTAIDHLSRMIERFPFSNLYNQRGQMYRAIYEWDNALADFNAALELTPDEPEIYYQRGLLYYSILQTGTETRPAALADFQRYLELAPDGIYAEAAARYANSIQAEQAALDS